MFLRKSIKVPLYVGYFDIVVMDNTIDFDNVYSEPFSRKEIYGHSIETTSKRDTFIHFVLVLNFNNPMGKITNGVIAHEALHITSYIMDYIGQDFDHNNHECFSYLLQWVTDQVYKFIEDNNLVVSTKQKL